MNILFTPFLCLAPQDFYFVWLSNMLSLSVPTWCRLSHKRIMHTKFDIWVIFCKLFIYSSNTLQITLPSGKPNGLSFADMDDHVELRPIPKTNIFIIRQRTDSSLSPHCTCVSKRHYYTISFGVNRIQIVKVRTK